MPTTLTSQFALYQALFVKVSESFLLCYKGIVYFLVFRCVQEGLFLAIRGSEPLKNTFEEIWSPSPLWDRYFPHCPKFLLISQ